MLRWLFGDSSRSATPTASDALRALVARSMPDTDAHSAAIVAAVAGLLATVAHADRVYSEHERAETRVALGRIGSLGAGAIDAVEQLLVERMAELAHEPLQSYTRVLYEGLERNARVEVLEVLLGLAAADDVLDMQETNLLRRIARSLGVSDEEYVALQGTHRERLSVLRGKR